MSNEIAGQLQQSSSELTVEWQIAYFFSLKKQIGKSYVSNLFYFLDKTWQLKIYPNGNTEKSSGYISLYVTVKGSAPSKIVDYSFSLKRLDGEQEELTTLYNLFKKDDCGWGMPKFFLRSDLHKRRTELVPSNVLTIICTLKYDLDVTMEDEVAQNTNIEACTQTDPDICIGKLQQEFKELLVSGKNSDITLDVKGKEFMVHRSILAARSPVFSAMMDNEMKEKASGIASIDDSDMDSFPDFLSYLYTANVEDLTAEKALNLYITADKYQVNELKVICLKHMVNSISVENFCDLLSLSLHYHEKELTDAASGFFVRNSMAILLTTKWQVFLSENSVASNELLIKLVREKIY